MNTRSALPVFELICLFVVVYIFQMVTAFADLVEVVFVLQPPILDNPWTIVTSVFAHAGLSHLFSNAVALLVVGIPVAVYTTRARFYAFFLVAGALAGVSQIVLSDLFTVLPLVGFTASPGVLGASGGIFGLLGYLLTSNRISNSVSGIVNVPPWFTYLVLLALAVVLTVVTATSNAALIAHFVGLFIGLVAGRLNLLDPSRAR